MKFRSIMVKNVVLEKIKKIKKSMMMKTGEAVSYSEILEMLLEKYKNE